MTRPRPHGPAGSVPDTMAEVAPLFDLPEAAVAAQPEGTAALPLTIDPAGDRVCGCCVTHTPTPRELHRHHVWPTGEGGPNTRTNLRWLCPTTHSNVHKLWREYDAHGGTPPYAVRRLYSRYQQSLVAEGWALAHPGPT